MTRWEQFEVWLFENHPNGGVLGSSRDIAALIGIDREEMSGWIGSYLTAQRAQSSRTLFVLHREGRTSNAVWHSGVRTADVRGIGGQYFDDVRQKFLRAVEPDIRRIAVRNPRAARQCEVIVSAVSEGAMKVLQAAVGGMEYDEPPEV